MFAKYKQFVPIFGICFVFSVLYAVLSVIHHNHFLSGGFDLGIYDQGIWQYAHFLYPFNTIKEKIIIGDHLTLTLPLLAPLYWIWDDVRSVLVFQAFWISFSAVPIYLYLLKRGFTTLQAHVLAFLYLLFYGMQYLVYFDFHPVALGVGLLAWILYFWEAEKWKWFWIAIPLLLLTQENMGVALFGLCLLWFFHRTKRKKLLLFLSLLSIVYTIVAFGAIKIIAHGALEYVPQFPHTFPQLLTRFYDTQDKRDVWLFSFSWFSFLPLFSPGAVLAVILDLAQYFPTGDAFNHTWTPYLHHRAILSIFLIVGAADVLLFLKAKKAPVTLLVIGMLFVSLFLQFHFHFALNKLTKTDYLKTEQWMRDNNAVIARVPKNASVATQQSLVPHLSHRKEIYLVYPRQHAFKKSVCSEKNCWWLDFDRNPDYLLVDSHDGEWLTMTLAAITDYRNAIKNMENAHVIELVYKKNEAKLYKINNAIRSSVEK